MSSISDETVTSPTITLPREVGGSPVQGTEKQEETMAPAELAKQPPKPLLEVTDYRIAGVKSRGLRRLMSFCKKRAQQYPFREEELASLSVADLFDLNEAANKLKVKGLSDQIIMKLAEMMKGKTCAEIMDVFAVENDCKRARRG